MAQFSYYAPEDFNRCRAQAAPAVALPSGGFGGGAVMGAFTGGMAGVPAGGLLGYGLSCEDEIRVTGHLFEFANDPQHRYRYYLPYEAKDARVVQLVSGYDGATPPHFCRLYHVEYLGGDRQWRAFQTTMCLAGGRWLFPNAAPGVPVIVRQAQPLLNPAIRVQVAPLVRPEPARPPIGPYRFGPAGVPPYAQSEAIRHEVRRDLEEDRAIRPPAAFNPPDPGPVDSTFYQPPRRIQ